MAKITDFLEKSDIDLGNKLGNLWECEISDAVYRKCMEKETFHSIKDKIWQLMNDDDEVFSQASFYDGLAKEYEADDIYDLKSAELYNCDLLYMVAIASVLNLPRPTSSGQVEIFGM